MITYDIEQRLSELEAIVAARYPDVLIARGRWDDLLHPRGKDGRFITKGGFVSGLFKFLDGSSSDKPERAEVMGFAPNTDDPDNPLVELRTPDGRMATANAHDLDEAAATKARLDTPDSGALPDEVIDEPTLPKPKVPKVLDLASVDAGLNYDGSAEHDPVRMMALEWTQWDLIPNEMVDPASLVAVEEYLSSKSVNKVVSGEVPLRKGYTVKVARTPDGQNIIVDGHHRAAMAAMMGEPLEVKIATIDEMSITDPAAMVRKIAEVHKSDNIPILVTDLDEAVRLLADGQKIELSQPDQVSTLLSKVKAYVDEVKAATGEPPNLNLCNVTAAGTNLFCVESKGISRIAMPQFSGTPLPGSPADLLGTKDGRGGVDLTNEFREHLASKGISVEDTTALAGHLRASQAELDGVKVAGMTQALAEGTLPEGAIFISSDNYVVDGHHRWAANIAHDLADGETDLEMGVMRIDMGIIDLLAEANDFTTKWGIPQASANAKGRRPRAQPLSPENESHPLAGRVREIVGQATMIEPEVTDGLEGLVQEHQGQLVGLDFRFKASDGILDKAMRKSKDKDIPLERALEKVDDALRYTMVLPVDGHRSRVSTLLNSMADRGFDLDEVENNWVPGDAYNGVNAVFTHRESGMKVELQLHTADTYWVKQYGTHADYEIFRSLTATEPERKAAFDRMTQLADAIDWPDGMESLDIGITQFRPYEPRTPSAPAASVPNAAVPATV